MNCFHGHGPAHIIADILMVLPFAGILIFMAKDKITYLFNKLKGSSKK